MTHTKRRNFTVGEHKVSVQPMTGRMEHYVSVRIRTEDGEETDSYMLHASEVDNHAKKRGWVAA